MAAALTLHMALIAHRHARHAGDYEISREFGRRFIANEYLYRGGLHFPYLPAAAMYFSPLALVPVQAGILARYCLAIFCVWLVLKLLFIMLREVSPRLAGEQFAVSGVTILLSSHYLIRDLDDGGPHIVLMAMVVGGIYCAWRRKAMLGALWLGLATALKITPGIFVPYFVWKRQWRLAFYTALAAMWFIALPMVWMGPANWWFHQREWMRSSVGFLFNRNTAAAAHYGVQSIQNQSLGPAVTKWLGAAFNLLGALGLAAPLGAALPAGKVAALAKLALLGWFCSRTRHRFRSCSDPNLLLESSGLMILALLLSPITWVQHLVFAFPALYLVVAEHLTIRKLGPVAEAAMVFFAVSELLLNREFVTKPVYDVLLEGHTHTFSILLLFMVLMLRRPASRAAQPGG